MHKIALLGFLTLVQGIRLNQDLMTEETIVEVPAETTTTVTTTTVTAENGEAGTEETESEIAIDASEGDLDGITIDETEADDSSDGKHEGCCGGNNVNIDITFVVNAGGAVSADSQAASGSSEITEGVEGGETTTASTSTTTTSEVNEVVEATTEAAQAAAADAE